MIKYYIKLGFDFSRESFENLTVEFIGEYYDRFNECKLFYETEKVLQEIKDLGISQSILSASKEDILVEKLNIIKLKLFFAKSSVCIIITLKAKLKEEKNG